MGKKMIWVKTKNKKGSPKLKKRTIGRVTIDLGCSGPYQMPEHLLKHLADVVEIVDPPEKKSKPEPGKDGGEK